MFICNFEIKIDILDFYSIMSTFCYVRYIETHNKNVLND